MPYKTIPETATADVAYEVTGKDLNQLFEDAILATESSMVELDTVEPTQEKTFEKSADKLDTLLYDVLDELIFLKDTDSFVAAKAKAIIQNNPPKAIITIFGEVIDLEKHTTLNDAKAMTYHMFELKEEGDHWKAFFIIDV